MQAFAFHDNDTTMHLKSNEKLDMTRNLIVVAQKCNYKN